MFQDLEQSLETYNKEQGDVCARMCKTTDNQVVIAICTPLMKRVHARLRESGEMVFVDSSGNCDRHNHRLAFSYSSPIPQLVVCLWVYVSPRLKPRQLFQLPWNCYRRSSHLTGSLATQRDLVLS